MIEQPLEIVEEPLPHLVEIETYLTVYELETYNQTVAVESWVTDAE